MGDGLVYYFGTDVLSFFEEAIRKQALERRTIRWIHICHMVLRQLSVFVKITLWRCS